MKLNVLERIVGLEVIDEYKEGNFITFKLIAKLRLKLAVSEEEEKLFDLRVEDGKYLWNAKGQEATELELTDGETKLIKDQLAKIDEENRLCERHLSLYEKFIGE
jgi:hypothetical protein